MSSCKPGGRITTFKLPRDETRRKDWIQAIPKRKYPPTVNHNVCILHFNEEDFSRNNRRIDLKKNAIPSIFPFVDGQSYDESTDICDEVRFFTAFFNCQDKRKTFQYFLGHFRCGSSMLDTKRIH